MDWRSFYEDNYKALMLIPLLILVLAFGILFSTFLSTGEWFQKGVDLSGGTQFTVSVDGEVDAATVEDSLREEFESVNVRELGGVGREGLLVSAKDAEPDAVRTSLSDAGVSVTDFSYQQIGPALGESFFKQSQHAFLFAFLFMAGVVFVAFRGLVPSLGVIQAAFTDVVATLAVMQIVDINLTLASFAGLLLTIGYSVDTDILLTTKLLKRKGDMTDRLVGAAKTGLTMTLTAVVALTALYFVSTSATLSNIAAVLVIALLIDIPVTYLMNAGLLRWDMERK